MTWTFEGDTAPSLSPPYAKVFTLGSSAFAHYLIQGDLNEGVAGANVGFLRDPKNFDFVDTPHGRLGQLLTARRARIINPTYVDILPDAAGYRIHLRLDFPEGGHPWFARSGFVILERSVTEPAWKPISLLARRIWAGDQDWLGPERPEEAEAFRVVRDAAARTRGLVLDTEILRFVEFRSRGRLLGPDQIDRDAVFQNAELLERILLGTRGRVAPSEMVQFATFAGMAMVTMSDDGVISAAAMMSAGIRR